MPIEQLSYGMVISRNVVAARARARMSQSSLATRMKALGYPWYPQTVSTVERGERRLDVGELLGLALALETSLGLLLDPSRDDRLVEMPSGHAIQAGTILRLVRHFNDGMVSWEGDSPRFATQEPESWPDTEIGRQLRQEIRGLTEFGQSSADMIERNSRLSPEPPRGWPEPAPPPRVRREAVVAAIVTSRGDVLIGRRNDRTPPWTFIAGEQEPGEEPADTIVREVKEETGLEIRPGEIIGERNHPQTGRHMIYLAGRPAGASLKVAVGDEAELAEVRWVSLAEAEELLPDMHEPVRGYLTRELGGQS